MGLLFICSPDLTMACMGCRASLRSRNLCYQGARQPANKSSNKRRWENKRLIKKYSKSKMDPTRGSTTLRTFWQTSSGTTFCHRPILYIVTIVLMAPRVSCSQNIIWKKLTLRIMKWITWERLHLLSLRYSMLADSMKKAYLPWLFSTWSSWLEVGIGLSWNRW